ncbi:MAG TPA: hypothetical protein VM658_21325 [bacterium]|nr:hypothetical protein [bacterium]
MYFSSNRPEDDFYKLDIFVTHLIGWQWTTPERLPTPLNDPISRDGHPSLTLDGHYMYFHSSRFGGFGGTDADTGLDIWMSENIDGVWQQPVVLPLGVNSTTMDCTPFISVDGQTLIFSSGNPGERDLYIAHKVNGVWQDAVNMGAPFYTDLNEDSPSLSYTGKYLFMSRGGRGDGVASDIFRSVKINGIWQEPVRLPDPINAEDDEEQASFYNECTNTLYFYSTNMTPAWHIYTTQWLDFPDQNPCKQLIIPEGQWRLRVTLLEASAGLSSDIYIDEPISQLLIKKSLKNVGTVVSTPFLSADELVFHIHVDGRSLGLGEYNHYSDSEFARVKRTDPLRYIVGFEDLPADQADWDFNDTVLLVELVGVEVNIWEGQNYLGEIQVVEDAPPDQTTTLDLPLTRGAAVEASVSIPGGELAGPTYAILTQGEPVLYEEVVADAPFLSTGDFIKVELTNGQSRLDADPAQVSISYKDEDNDGFVDGTALMESELAVYNFNGESSAWQQLPSQVDPASNTVTAQTHDFSLFALGGKMPERLDDTPAAGNGKDTSVNGGLFGCWVGNAASPAAASNAILMLLLALAPAAAYRLRQSSR